MERCESECKKTKRTVFDINAAKLVANNLAGLGPAKSAKEMRYQHAGAGPDGKKFDLVVKVANGQTYRSKFFDKNGVSGQLGNINIDVDVTAQNKGFEQTEFEFSLQDSSTKAEVSLDKWEFTVYDMDVNKREQLHEILCFKMDEVNKSAFCATTLLLLLACRMLVVKNVLTRYSAKSQRLLRCFQSNRVSAQPLWPSKPGANSR